MIYFNKQLAINILFILVISLANSACIARQKQSADPPTRDGYENNISPNKHNFRLVSKPHPVRYGQISERYEVRDGDCGGSDCDAPRYRAELRLAKNKTRARVGEDIWYGWSFFNDNIPSFSKDKNMNITLGQWKMGGNNFPMIKMMQAGLDSYTDSIWKSCLRKYCSNHIDSNENEDFFIQLGDLWGRSVTPKKEANWAMVCRLFSLEKNIGKWVDIVLNTNFSDKKSGYLNIWINGKKKCEYRGPIIVEKDLSMYPGPNHRRGIFVSYTKRWDKNFPNQLKPTFVAYYDEFRIGQSRADVDIRLIEASGGQPVD